jgi:hypothetical protein
MLLLTPSLGLLPLLLLLLTPTLGPPPATTHTLPPVRKRSQEMRCTIADLIHRGRAEAVARWIAVNRPHRRITTALLLATATTTSASLRQHT